MSEDLPEGTPAAPEHWASGVPGPVPQPEPAPEPAPVQHTAVAQPYPAPPATVVQRRGLGLMSTIAVAAVVSLIIGSLAGLAGYVLGRSVDSAATSTAAGAGTTPMPTVGSTSTAATGPTLVRGSGAVARIADATLPAVVSVVVGDDQQGGSGSGFVIGQDGYIVTNNHVASAVPNGKIKVVFNDGTEVPGKVVGTSADYDVAVIKVNRTGLQTLALGDSDAVHVGDDVVAIGAPLGLDGTVTSGIVSALNRPVTAGETSDSLSFINAIQTDAAINPGNSGGPLLDASGKVIGVNSAIATLSGGSETGSIGLGFAIPANSVKRIAEELIRTGASKTPIMGVSLDEQFTGKGAKVAAVTPGSGAKSAGLAVGDVIVRLDSRVIDDATELVVAVRNYAPGDTVTVVYDRNGSERTADITLGDGNRNG